MVRVRCSASWNRCIFMITMVPEVNIAVRNSDTTIC